MSGIDERLGASSAVATRTAWTPRLTDAFFDALVATFDIEAAAAAAGVPVAEVRRRRRTHARFAARWEGAIEAGYHLIETRLICHVLAGSPKADSAQACANWDQAMRLFTLRGGRKAAATGTRVSRKAAADPGARTASRDETDAAILGRLAAIAAAARPPVREGTA